MHRDEQHVCPAPENALGAVAVVAVDVEDGHALRAPVAQALGGEGGVVEVAMPARPRRVGVMSGWAADGVGEARAVDHAVGGRDGAGGGGECGGPGAQADRAGCVGCVPAELPDHIARQPPAIAEHLRRGVDVGNGFRPMIGQSGPGGGQVTQEVEIGGQMNGLQRRPIRRAGLFERDAQIAAFGDEGLRAGGSLEIRPDMAALEKEFGRMLKLHRIPKRLHAFTPSGRGKRYRTCRYIA